MFFDHPSVELWLRPSFSILKPWTCRLAWGHLHIPVLRGKLPRLETNCQILSNFDFPAQRAPTSDGPVGRQFPPARVLLFKHHCSTSYVWRFERLGRRRVSIRGSESGFGRRNLASIRNFGEFHIFRKITFFNHPLVDLCARPSFSILKPWTCRSA